MSIERKVALLMIGIVVLAALIGAYVFTQRYNTTQTYSLEPKSVCGTNSRYWPAIINGTEYCANFTTTTTQTITATETWYNSTFTGTSFTGTSSINATYTRYTYTYTTVTP